MRSSQLWELLSLCRVHESSAQDDVSEALVLKMSGFGFFESFLDPFHDAWGPCLPCVGVSTSIELLNLWSDWWNVEHQMRLMYYASLGFIASEDGFAIAKVAQPDDKLLPGSNYPCSASSRTPSAHHVTLLHPTSEQQFTKTIA